MSIIIGILLLSSFSTIFYCSKWSLSVKEKYPKVNCAELNEEMKNAVDLWQKNAIQEFLMNQALEQKNEQTHYADTMQCFCKWQDSHKVSKKTVYELKDKEGSVEYSGPICL